MHTDTDLPWRGVKLSKSVFICTTNVQFLVLPRRFSGGYLQERADFGIAGGENGGDGGASIDSELIPMSFGQFAYQLVGAQQSEQSGDSPAGALLFLLRIAGLWKEERSQIAIAESGEDELAAGDSLEEL